MVRLEGIESYLELRQQRWRMGSDELFFDNWQWKMVEYANDYFVSIHRVTHCDARAFFNRCEGCFPFPPELAFLDHFPKPFVLHLTDDNSQQAYFDPTGWVLVGSGAEEVDHDHDWCIYEWLFFNGKQWLYIAAHYHNEVELTGNAKYRYVNLSEAASWCLVKDIPLHCELLSQCPIPVLGRARLNGSENAFVPISEEQRTDDQKRNDWLLEQFAPDKDEHPRHADLESLLDIEAPKRNWGLLSKGSIGGALREAWSRQGNGPWPKRLDGRGKQKRLAKAERLKD